MLIIVQNVHICEFGDFSWNHHEKCIQISTNMPYIGLAIAVCDTGFEFNDFLEKKPYFAWLHLWPRGKG